MEAFGSSWRRSTPLRSSADCRRRHSVSLRTRLGSTISFRMRPPPGLALTFRGGRDPHRPPRRARITPSQEALPWLPAPSVGARSPISSPPTSATCASPSPSACAISQPPRSRMPARRRGRSSVPIRRREFSRARSARPA
jgi:hypothetical protein